MAAASGVEADMSAPSSENKGESSFQSNSLSTINAQLMTQGWAKRPLNLNVLSETDFNDAVAVLFELLGASVNNINTLDALASRHRTLQYEHERLQKAQNNVKTTNARLETEVAGWKARCADVEKRLNLEEAKTKELREEVARGRKALDGVRIAAGHEAKKSQMKLDKAQAQLLKISNDASQTSRPQGLVLLNPIPAGKIQPVVAGQIPLLEQTLRELTDIRESLQEETEAFRHVVVTTGNGLREALALAAGHEPPARLLHSQFFSNTDLPSRPTHFSGTHTFQSASSTSHPSIANHRLTLLINDVRTKLTEDAPKLSPDGPAGHPGLTPEEFEEQKRLEREQEKVKRDLEDRVKDLEVEVVCAKAREQEAKKVVEEMARIQMEQGLSKIEAANQRDFEEDGTLEERKAAMEEERRRFTEAAGKLRDERLQLETERQAFLEEKRQADVDAVLALLPSTPDDAIAEPILVPQIGSESVSPPSSPGPSSWALHRPNSPSPLSPLHPRGTKTPKHHAAVGRRKSIKTPLSRLVLEKAVRQKGRETPASVERERLGIRILGPEGGTRTNASPSKKGKERAVSSTMSKQGSEQLKLSTLGKSRSSAGSTTSSTTSKPPLRSASSVRASTAPSTSQLGSSQRKVDLSKADGMGPRAAARGQRPWR